MVSRLPQFTRYLPQKTHTPKNTHTETHTHHHPNTTLLNTFVFIDHNKKYENHNTVDFLSHKNLILQIKFFGFSKDIKCLELYCVLLQCKLARGFKTRCEKRSFSRSLDYLVLVWNTFMVADKNYTQRPGKRLTLSTGFKNLISNSLISNLCIT